MEPPSPIIYEKHNSKIGELQIYQPDDNFNK